MTTDDRKQASTESAPNDSNGTTHFGFEDVAEADKAPRVRGVFESVATRYDLMNDLMSGGIHRLWKAAMITWLNPQPGMTLLDVAGGTGDIAFRVLDRLGERAGPIIVYDLTPEMLQTGRDRAIDRGLLSGATRASSFGSGTPGPGIAWVCGNAEALPLPDCSVDAYTIAFGLRNTTRIDVALAEARRVLKPGGRFLCLEFSQVILPVLARLYDLYSFEVLPAMGALVAGDRDAYRYLVESIRRFPAQDELATMMKAAGLDQVRYRNLTGGVAALHSGWRL